MMTLPRERPLARGALRAFWLAACTTAGIAACVAPWAPARTRVPWSLAAAGLGATAGMARPGVARRPYRAWDRLSRGAADTASTYLAWVTHATAIPAQPEPAFGPRTPGSAWRHAETQPSSSYPSLELPTSLPRRRWLDACLALLRAVQDPEEPPPPVQPSGDVYSLS